MSDALLAELVAARQSRTPCALVTIAATRGSVPRAAGSKMLVYANGKVSGTIGGGKFESLAVSEALERMREKKPFLKTYHLREGSSESFGAICGGESTILIEPQLLNEAVFLVGAGHCSLAIAKLAVECGFFVTIVDDRPDLLALFPPQTAAVSDIAPAQFIESREWQGDEALVMVSRNPEIDRDALEAALRKRGMGYVGMIGSERKVQRVLDQLTLRGIGKSQLAEVYAPMGLDIGADSPAEIAVSVMGEILAVLRKRPADHLRTSSATK